jgi:hypothetical protein
MSRFAKILAANAIAAAGLGAVAVALSSPAGADPVVPPIVPGVPALGMLQDFASNPAGVGGAVLQTAATALNGASSMLGAPAPNTLPISPIPGSVPESPIPGSLPVSPIPGAPALPPVPAAPVPAPTGVIGSTVVPLLTQIGIPAQLANLAPVAAAAPAVAPVTPVAPIAPLTPVAPVAPGAALNPIPLLNALP